MFKVTLIYNEKYLKFNFVDTIYQEVCKKSDLCESG